MFDWLNFRLGIIIGLIHALEKKYSQNKTQLRYNFGSTYYIGFFKLQQNLGPMLGSHQYFGGFNQWPFQTTGVSFGCTFCMIMQGCCLLMPLSLLSLSLTLSLSLAINSFPFSPSHVPSMGLTVFCLRLSILSVCLSICLSVCLCLPVCLCLSVCLSLSACLKDRATHA